VRLDLDALADPQVLLRPGDGGAVHRRAPALRREPRLIIRHDLARVVVNQVPAVADEHVVHRAGRQGGGRGLGQGGSGACGEAGERLLLHERPDERAAGRAAHAFLGAVGRGVSGQDRAGVEQQQVVVGRQGGGAVDGAAPVRLGGDGGQFLADLDVQAGVREALRHLLLEREGPAAQVEHRPQVGERVQVGYVVVFEQQDLHRCLLGLAMHSAFGPALASAGRLPL
jgi:hypothetical protein